MYFSLFSAPSLSLISQFSSWFFSLICHTRHIPASFDMPPPILGHRAAFSYVLNIGYRSRQLTYVVLLVPFPYCPTAAPSSHTLLNSLQPLFCEFFVKFSRSFTLSHSLFFLSVHFRFRLSPGLGCGGSSCDFLHPDIFDTWDCCFCVLTNFVSF